MPNPDVIAMFCLADLCKDKDGGKLWPFDTALSFFLLQKMTLNGVG